MTLADDDLPELVIGDGTRAIVGLLGRLQRAALVHPEAARSLFASLAREGELFAETDEGRRWKDLLARSALLERALLVWQAATLWITETPAETVTPSAVVDAVAAAAASPERARILDRLFRQADQAGEGG